MRLLVGLFVFALAIGPVSASEGEGAEVRLVLFADGFTAPLMVVEPPDDSRRIFVVDQPGWVWVVDRDGQVDRTPFLDLSAQILDIEASYDERGLLGLAFHRDFASNGRFFVYYSAPLADGAPDDWDHTSYVSEFVVSDDPNRADPDSERIVLRIDQPYHNHNAGQIAMGPDGYLYVPLGDGGNGGDIDAEGEDRGRPDAGWAQTVESPLGSILRLDVDDDEEQEWGRYGIPPDNPFVGDDAVPDEVFAYGFRNPYGLTFDLETADIYVADAGQILFEEVSRVEAGGNYGWNIKEGTHCFNPDDFTDPPDTCPDTGPLGEPLIDPVIEYQRAPDAGSVVIPGVLSRDSSVPILQDRFVFGDYATIRFIPTGVIYAATPNAEGLWPIERVTVGASADAPTGGLNRFLLGVNQDSSGRLYVLTTEMGGPEGNTGAIFNLEDPNAPAAADWALVAGVLAGVVLAGSLITVWLVRRGRFTSGAVP